MAGFVFIFLPQWVPAARDAASWLWSSFPKGPTVSLSWDWITAPVGLIFLGLVWWETRKRRPAEAQGDEGALIIRSARYGLSEKPGEYVDVTEAVRGYVKGHRLDITVTNDALRVGNPFKGQRKTIFVSYSASGKAVVGERQRLEIPPR